MRHGESGQRRSPTYLRELANCTPPVSQLRLDNEGVRDRLVQIAQVEPPSVDQGALEPSHIARAQRKIVGAAFAEGAQRDSFLVVTEAQAGRSTEGQPGQVNPHQDQIRLADADLSLSDDDE